MEGAMAWRERWHGGNDDIEGQNVWVWSQEKVSGNEYGASAMGLEGKKKSMGLVRWAWQEKEGADEIDALQTSNLQLTDELNDVR